jgi:hypothetical protein
MLTPETLDALDNALTAVIHEAGHDPKYADLVHALTAAQAALPEDNDADDAVGGGELDKSHPDDVHPDAPPAHGPAAFQAAKAKMIAARRG